MLQNLWLERNTLNLKRKQANNKLFKRPFNTEWLQKLSLSNDAKYKTFLAKMRFICIRIKIMFISIPHTEGLFKWRWGGGRGGEIGEVTCGGGDNTEVGMISVKTDILV